MEKATIRDLRYRFPEVEARLREGKPIEITRRKRIIARLVPVAPKAKKAAPDFMEMLREIYGRKAMKVSGAELVAKQRGEY